MRVRKKHPPSKKVVLTHPRVGKSLYDSKNYGGH